MIDRKTLIAAAVGFSLAAGGALVLQAANAPTPKGYLVAEIEVQDAEGYQRYASQTPPIIAKHGGKYLVRGGRTVGLEGTAPASRIAILEFPSVEAARGYAQSAEYQAIATIRHKTATSRVYAVEGVAATPR